jgi:pantoate--beta-alanine ligase
MQTVKKKKEINDISNYLKKEGKKIGLVPTMGYLHEGHISLMKKAKKECDIVILSIFINPIQFGPKEDFKRYPRDLKRDEAIAKKNGIDYIFYPPVSQMYSNDHKTYVRVLQIDEIMCGKTRKKHFMGVCTVVLKLFNIINPDVAYFGLKDYQQFIVIKKMTKDLDLSLTIKGLRTIREKDGLALSSRNKYLSFKERENANILYKTLIDTKKKILLSQDDISFIQKESIEKIKSNKYVKKIDYFDIRDAKNLGEIKQPKKGQKILIASAVFIGHTRLIDNIVFNF